MNKNRALSLHLRARSLFVARLAIILIAFVAFNAYGQDNPIALDNDDIYKKSLAALTILFVIAILLESALAVIFNWRVFLAYFNLRGAKTLIMIGVSWSVVSVFDVNVFKSLLETYGVESSGSGNLSKFLTALILAGGSSGVNNIMVALGYRDKDRVTQKTPKVPANKAWVAINVKRKEATGHIGVLLSKSSPQPSNMPSAYAGTISKASPAFRDQFLRNPRRFPQSGGFVVEPDVAYELELVATDSSDQKVQSAIDGTYVFARGAIVDLEVTL
jgi:hypothetical protein